MENNPFYEIIDKDSTIMENDRLLFRKLADYYYSNFQDNLLKTSVQLSIEYPQTSANEWMAWLEIPGIKKFRDKFIKEQIEQNTNSTLAFGNKTQGAVQVRKMLDSQNDNNMANFIVMRLPDREE